jgi:predicted RNA binding protein YcfA (HicA-like mRNA interferase family)
MNNPSPAEIALHASIVNQQRGSFDKLLDQYGTHLLTCLKRWYGACIQQDELLAQETVYTVFNHYFSHPLLFNAQQGSLKKFLEIQADRIIQKILSRENYVLHPPQLNHLLTLHFDNEQDIQLARLLLRNEGSLLAYAHLLNAGGYPMHQLLSEVNRQKERIGIKLMEMRGSHAQARKLIQHKQSVVAGEATDFRKIIMRETANGY